MSLGLNAGRLNLGNKTLAEAAAAVIRSYGSNAHVYLPGSTVTSYGAELVTNGGPFATTTDWTSSSASLAAYSGALRVSGSSAYGAAVQTIACSASKRYAVAVAVGISTALPANVRVRVGSAAQDGSLLDLTPSADGTVVTGQFTATASSHVLSLVDRTSDGVSYAEFISVSVREVITTSSVTSGLAAGNYTLSDGSTGYSAIDGTAGLALDAAGAVGVEQVVNGGFDVDANWTKGAGWSITGGAAVASGATANLTQSGVAPSPVGKTYKVSLAITAFTSGSIIPQIGGSMVTLNAAGNYTFYLTPTGNDATLYIATSGFTGTIDNVSVMQVTGIHASQSSGAARPGVRRGLLNLLTYSNDFTGWGKAGAPTVTASTVTRTVTGPTYVQGPSVAKAAAAMPYSLIGKFTAGTGRYVAMRAQSIYPNFADAVFDLQNGTVYSSATNGSFTGQIASIVKAANGECTCCVSFTTDAGTAVYGFASPNSNGVAIDGTDSSATSSFSSGGMAVAQGVWTAQGVLNEGGIPLTLASAASNSGAGRYSWQFDGSNDSLALGSVPFQMSDDHCVVGAAASQSSTSDRYISDVGNSGSVNAMCASLALNGTSAKVYWRDDSLANTTLTGGTVVQGSAGVLSARKSSGTGVLRVNGTQVATGAISLGTTTLTGASIGVRVSPGNYFNGSIGPIILIKGTVSDADLLTLERWVASQTPNGPVF